MRAVFLRLVVVNSKSNSAIVMPDELKRVFINGLSNSFVGTYFLPIEQLQKPRDEILIRKIDPVFLQKLQNEMEREPEGNYGLSYVLVKNCMKKDFKADKLEAYEYEVIGGLHNMTAAKALHEKYPDNPHFKGRHSRVYCELRNDEALWLASRHNLTAAMRHEMSFFEEVR